MTRTTPRSGRRPELSSSVARLDEERDALRKRASQLTDDMAALIAASRDSNADDEHDPEGQTIAYERSQLSAVTNQTLDHLREVEAALERVSAGTAKHGVVAFVAEQLIVASSAFQEVVANATDQDRVG